MQLTVNAIRVYSVDSSLNHDECMSALDAAGIYTMYVCRKYISVDVANFARGFQT